MRIRRALAFPLAVAALAMLILAGAEAAQQRRGGAPEPAAGGGAAQPAARGGAAQPAAPQAAANLNQLMRAILFPNSNVLFAVQSDDPTKLKGTREPSTATDPLTGLYGGWQAVENGGLAIAEAANLLTVPGRRCSNGRPVPMQNADWRQVRAGSQDRWNGGAQGGAVEESGHDPRGHRSDLSGVLELP